MKTRKKRKKSWVERIHRRGGKPSSPMNYVCENRREERKKIKVGKLSDINERSRSNICNRKPKIQ